MEDKLKVVCKEAAKTAEAYIACGNCKGTISLDTVADLIYQHVAPLFRPMELELDEWRNSATAKTLKRHTEELLREQNCRAANQDALRVQGERLSRAEGHLKELHEAYEEGIDSGGWEFVSQADVDRIAKASKAAGDFLQGSAGEKDSQK